MIDMLQQRGRENVLGKIASFEDAVFSLSQRVQYEYGATAVARVAALHSALRSPLSEMRIITIGGTNGKSTAVHCCEKLFREESIAAGVLYSSHVRSYLERFSVNGVAMTGEQFAQLVQEVSDVALQTGVAPTAQEVVMMVGALFAKRNGAEVFLLEVTEGGSLDIAAIANPAILAITRVAVDGSGYTSEDLDEAACDMVGLAHPGTWVISAEQSKIRLQKMKAWVEQKNGLWVMPIRKLAPLSYLHEQLFGRVASLSERIVQLYVEEVQQKFSPFLRGNLLATRKGQRGRPTLEAKREAELNPVRTLKSFWTRSFELLPGRFEIRADARPKVLLDCADNLDAFENVFLGIRLYQYQGNMQGFVMIMGVSSRLNKFDLVRDVRYLMRKVSGDVFFVPVEGQSHDPHELAALAKEYNIRAQAFESLEDALRVAKNTVRDDRGLIAITGSKSLVSEYWKLNN